LLRRRTVRVRPRLERQRRLPSRVSLIVAAAGRGARLGAATPKQYLVCAGKPLICHALEALAAARAYCAATVVIHPDDRARYQSALAFLSPAAAAAFGPPALGGDSRQQSVRAGLESQSPISSSSMTPRAFFPLPRSSIALSRRPSALAPPRPARRSAIPSSRSTPMAASSARQTAPRYAPSRRRKRFASR
jgi:hypothetical protein